MPAGNDIACVTMWMEFGHVDKERGRWGHPTRAGPGPHGGPASSAD